MSIASPRPSTSIRSPSSTRTSFDSAARPPTTTTTRRNRSALRDYYGLKAAAAAKETADAKISEESTRTDVLDADEDDTLPELDTPAFNAEAFVEGLLAREGLKGVLRVEADLISQIRTLDSDRKSLVYDNYSKLLAATSTIRRMRTNMDPLTPATHTLGPAIAHIAQTAAGLSSAMQSLSLQKPGPQGLGIDVRIEGAQEGSERDDAARKNNERDTVRWVLDTPRRLHELRDQERDEEADGEWEAVRRMLERWEGVAGVAELRRKCEGILQDEEDDESESEAESDES
ncbi:Vps51/Vps67-domain-containing protein [Massariosphaeria phaeospora]|uniref:Vacuolar protein sorting-associated protein 51 homolog n=1 Tax=Massariosphaeria phaeospora TaxID=100035 RepID=A0A7C8I4M6_9PLEO|nr:Vps51/Vps67-domain-containing protein [Massariosphaeria phaeospora]